MTCKRCEGDGYLDIMDPDHSGAVIGAQPCPECDGTGTTWLTSDEDDWPDMEPEPAAAPEEEG